MLKVEDAKLLTYRKHFSRPASRYEALSKYSRGSQERRSKLMAAATKKKTVMKKEKQSAAKLKTVKSTLRKVTAKPSGKTKKTVISEKQGMKISTAKKAVVKKSLVIKMGKTKKSQEKTGTSKDRLMDLKNPC